ncbi:unnamed protein product [Closterium sp. Naga37s-1]|nr:unnamed protein product [Closterium sp. Naga37s-1]
MANKIIPMEAVASQRKLVGGWRPRKGKYLLALCTTGRLTNQLPSVYPFPSLSPPASAEQQECIMTYFIFAVLLNRTLLIPPLAVAQHTGLNLIWPWTAVFNVPRLHTCLSPSYGPLTTLLLPDYLARSHSPHAYVAHLICLKPTCNHEWTLRVLLREVPEIKLADKKGRPIAVNQSLVDRMGKVQLEKLLEAVKVVEGEEERAEAEEGGRAVEGESHADSSGGEQVKEQIGGSGAVGKGAAAAGGGSRGEEASMRRRLNEVGSGAEETAIMEFVDGFIATHLPSPFMAVHLRRGDFSGHLKNQSYKRHVFLPIAAVGDFILSRVAAANLHTVLLASDGTDAEVAMLTQLITANNSTRLVTLHESRFTWADTHNEPWGQALLALEQSLPEGGGKGVVRALAEKYICARAHVFYGTVYSTFSTDIIRIRAAEGVANCMDGKVGEEG